MSAPTLKKEARRQRRQFNVACLDDLKTADPLLTYLCDNKQVYMYSKLRVPEVVENIESQFNPNSLRSPIKFDHEVIASVDPNATPNFISQFPSPKENDTRSLSVYSTDSEEALFDQLECLLRVRLPPSEKKENTTRSYMTPSVIHSNPPSLYLDKIDNLLTLKEKSKSLPSRIKEKTLTHTKNFLSPFIKSHKSTSSQSSINSIPHSPSDSLASCTTLNELNNINTLSLSSKFPSAEMSPSDRPVTTRRRTMKNRLVVSFPNFIQST